jgi:hypothetical protein
MSGASKAVQEAYESLSLVVGADGKEALDVLLAAATLPTAVGMDVAEVARAAAGPKDHYDCNRTWLERFRALCVAQRTEECAKLLEMTSSELLLLGGEMTAQELRTVKAVLAERARQMRRMSGR